jgi:curved DNA-binding protein CbpA
MSDPYEILGIPRNADETVVRQRYLELVREFPPDQAPERFAAIHRAYSALRDPAERVHNQIFRFDHPDDSFDRIIADLRERLTVARLPVDVLLALADSP